MNIATINRWLVLGANVGVLVVVMLQVVEIRQNSDLMCTEIHSMRAAVKADRQMSLANDGEIARILAGEGLPVPDDDGSWLRPPAVVDQAATACNSGFGPLTSAARRRWGRVGGPLRLKRPEEGVSSGSRAAEYHPGVADRNANRRVGPAGWPTTRVTGQEGP